MKYCIGIDLGTSSVKAILVDQTGEVCAEASKNLRLIQPKSGWSEQDPEEWTQQTLAALSELVEKANVPKEAIEGLSFSGQMHGLVLLDKDGGLLRNAILWNDTRTTPQCRRIDKEYGRELLGVTKNKVLEGFTLPKLLWVQEEEPEVFQRAAFFLLPKDYLRYRLTGTACMEYSDAAGTLLLDVVNKKWDTGAAAQFSIPVSLFPPLIESDEQAGTLLPEVLENTGLSSSTKVFAGGADNACGALGAGIVTQGQTMCSIGTSGVLLAYEESGSCPYEGEVHYFNHGKRDAYYSMGVTLSAGQSVKWLNETFDPDVPIEELTAGIDVIPPGSEGLLFTPYLFGERMPHADSSIRASFIGMDASHTKKHFVRAVMEGVTFSLRESLEMLSRGNREISSVVSIGGGAKNAVWLQMQADIFQTKVIKLENEQGPALGAAILAASGLGWFSSIEECVSRFITPAEEYDPDPKASARYQELYTIYKRIYSHTKGLCDSLMAFKTE